MKSYFGIPHVLELAAVVALVAASVCPAWAQPQTVLVGQVLHDVGGAFSESAIVHVCSAPGKTILATSTLTRRGLYGVLVEVPKNLDIYVEVEPQDSAYSFSRTPNFNAVGDPFEVLPDVRVELSPLGRYRKGAVKPNKADLEKELKERWIADKAAGSLPDFQWNLSEYRNSFANDPTVTDELSKIETDLGQDADYQLFIKGQEYEHRATLIGKLYDLQRNVTINGGANSALQIMSDTSLPLSLREAAIDVSVQVFSRADIITTRPITEYWLDQIKQDPSGCVLYESALTALLRTHNTEATSMTEKLLSNATYERVTVPMQTIIASLDAIGTAGTPVAVRQTQKLVSSAGDPEVQIAAIRTLTSLGFQFGNGEVFTKAMLDGTNTSNVRIEAAKALGNSKTLSGQEREAFERMSLESSPDLQAVAKNVLIRTDAMQDILNSHIAINPATGRLDFQTIKPGKDGTPSIPNKSDISRPDSVGPLGGQTN